MALDLVEALIRTSALRIAPPGELFWYTSGTVGPYYINAHFLCGGPETAVRLLEFIEQEKDDRRSFPRKLCDRILCQHEADATYRAVISLLVQAVREHDGPVPDYVSGGERRDWFFSAAVAMELDRPHLLVYKDRSLLLSAGTEGNAEVDLGGRTIVHAADLVTEASSYTRTWIPAVRRAGGKMSLSVNVVDRGQGGLEAIGGAGVTARALIRVDSALFDRLLERGVIDRDQHKLLKAYLADPRGAMKAFLEARPAFLQEALHNDDPKIRDRACRMVAENPYGLGPEFLGTN